MNYPFKCPACNTDLESDVNEEGNTIDCPNCGQPFVVPPLSFPTPRRSVQILKGAIQKASAIATAQQDPSNELIRIRVACEENAAATLVIRNILLAIVFLWFILLLVGVAIGIMH